VKEDWLQSAKLETVVILDFGSQYSQLIARRVREQQVYCELISHSALEKEVMALNPRGFILSGGPAGVYEEGAPQLPAYVMESGLPILGICYGMQLLAHHLGGKVSPASKRDHQHKLSPFLLSPFYSLCVDEPRRPH
jgi:GMP synthase (glutamine-hydrolysing)